MASFLALKVTTIVDRADLSIKNTLQQGSATVLGSAKKQPNFNLLHVGLPGVDSRGAMRGLMLVVAV